MVERSWRSGGTERLVIADIGPEPGGLRPALRQQRDRGVVPVQTSRGQDMLFDQGMDGRQCDRSVADQIGQGGEAELDPFASEALCLTVQRLVLPELLVDNHGDQTRACPAARDGVEGCRGLAGSGIPSNRWQSYPHFRSPGR